jgi:hypothetical protein
VLLFSEILSRKKVLNNDPGQSIENITHGKRNPE